MIQSMHSKHVSYFPPGILIEKKTYEGGWYFFNEADLIEGGPYPSEEKALMELEKYGRELLNWASQQ